MGTGSRAICWFRRDLRLDDNPAWSVAARHGDLVVPVFVLDSGLLGAAGPLRRSLLFAHLVALDEQLNAVGGRLRVLTGQASTVIPELVEDIGAELVAFNADTTPFAVRRDKQVVDAIGDRAAPQWGTLVHRPGTVLTAKGTLSQVFTPFYRRWSATEWDRWPQPVDVEVADDPGEGVPRPEMAPPHAGGQLAAEERVEEFLTRVDDYLETRDAPAVDGTSALSSDLRFGTLSPRALAMTVGESNEARSGFVRQLAWRDWYAHLLYENPHMPHRAMRPDYDKVAWRDADDDFDSWCRGQTGFPIVDAGMRQLNETGWMHNRVRMIVGSFLVKDLLIDWRRGEAYFRRVLIDGDVAQNVGNWQWIAGTGPDSAPYFRVFNPVSQSRKFDPAAEYLRRWVPELAGLDDRLIHAPWEAAPLDLAAAGVVLGESYPEPLVDHAAARTRVLSAYKTALGKTD